MAVQKQAVEKKEKKKLEKQALPEIKPGYTIRVHQEITEGDKTRVQVYEGMVIGMRGKTPETKTMTVYKVSQGVGVEKIYPLALPSILRVDIVKKAKVNRAKLNYIKGYKKHLQEEILKVEK